MLYKFSFVPNVEKTQEALMYRNPGASEIDVQEALGEAIRSVFDPSYDVYVFCNSLIEGYRKLDEWINDQQGCLLTHPEYDSIIFTLIGECVSASDRRDVVLNALAIID